MQAVSADHQVGFPRGRVIEAHAGTARVADINPGPQSPGIRDLTAVGNTLYFFVDQPPERAGLWKADGTALGTSLVIGMRGTHLLARNGKLYFMYQSSLYESDGTAEGLPLRISSLRFWRYRLRIAA